MPETDLDMGCRKCCVLMELTWLAFMELDCI